MNQYPLWKNLLVLVVVVSAIVLALPNLFGNVPAVMVSPAVGEATTEWLEESLETVRAAGIDQVDGKLVAGKAQLRFAELDDQTLARDALGRAFGNRAVIAPNLVSSSPDWLTLTDPMYLGLDLRGGVHFLMQVDMDAAIEKAYATLEQDVRVLLRDERIRFRSVSRESDQVTVVLRNAEDRDSAVAEMRRQHPQIELTEPGDNRLVYGDAADWLAAEESGRIPAAAKLYQQRDGRGAILLNRRVIVSGDEIKSASSGIDSQSGSPAVFVNLNGTGANRMQRVTAENVGEPMAVVYKESNYDRIVEDDGTIRHEPRISEEVINVATIQDVLSHRFQTTGLASDEARHLSLLISAGSLSAPVYIIEERTVGPSLGKENIARGFTACIVGLLLVMGFMLWYYRFFGLLANLALAVNIVMVVAVLSLIQATLTLPGIAGVVLTVGMAVDANVLIFERIREELRRGSPVQQAIHAGYDRAVGTIADANITTLIAALVLFAFGTGAIQGFAVTLSIGIATSMFTAIIGTRALVNLRYGGRRVKTIAI